MAGVTTLPSVDIPSLQFKRCVRFYTGNCRHIGLDKKCRNNFYDATDKNYDQRSNKKWDRSSFYLAMPVFASMLAKYFLQCRCLCILICYQFPFLSGHE